MAFRFNWSAMDDSVAEIVRLLVNQKLEERVRAQLSATSAASSPSSSLLPTGLTSGGLPGSGVSAGATATPAASAAMRSTVTADAPSGGVGGGLTVAGFGSRSISDDATPALLPFSQGGMSQGDGGGAATATNTANNRVTSSIPLTGGGLAGAATTMHTPLGSVGGGPAVVGSAPTHFSLSASPPPSNTAFGSGAPTSSAAGAAVGLGGTNTRASGQTSSNGNNAAANSMQNNRSHSGGTGPHRGLPPIRELYVDSIEWGVTAPFIEIVNFEDAIPFDAEDPEDNAHENEEGSEAQGLSAQGGLLPATPKRQPSTSSVRPSSSVTTATEQEDTAGVFSGGPRTTSGTVSRVAGSLEAPSHVAPQRGSAPTDTGDNGNKKSRDGHHGLPADDRMSPIWGPSGVFMCFHVTYGGSLSFSVKTVVQHELAVGPISLPVSMPLEIRASDVDLDCFVCLNAIHNECRLWLEPGKLSASPLNRLNLTVVFGTDRVPSRANARRDVGSDSLNNSAVFSHDYEAMDDAYDAYESTSSEGIEDDESVYVDESAISQFALRELKAILQEKLVAPHYVRIPFA